MNALKTQKYCPVRNLLFESNLNTFSQFVTVIHYCP